jgi:hypothetical protein
MIAGRKNEENGDERGHDGPRKDDAPPRLEGAREGEDGGDGGAGTEHRGKQRQEKTRDAIGPNPYLDDGPLFDSPDLSRDPGAEPSPRGCAAPQVKAAFQYESTHRFWTRPKERDEIRRRTSKPSPAFIRAQACRQRQPFELERQPHLLTLASLAPAARVARRMRKVSSSFSAYDEAG